MLLFKGHPESVGKTQRKYKAIPMAKKQEIVEELREGMHGYRGYEMRGGKLLDCLWMQYRFMHFSLS